MFKRGCCLLIAVLLATAAHAADDAESLLRGYLLDVQDAIGADPAALGSQNGVLLKLDEIGRKHLTANKELLNRRAAEEYLRLSICPEQLLDNAVSLRLGREDDFEVLERLFGPDGYGTAPFDYHVVVTRWWDPLYAARTIRDVVSKELLRRDQRERQRFIEQFAPPRVYRQSDDPQAPVVVFFGSRELFVVKLAYLDAGVYCLKALEWYRLPAGD